MKVKQLNHDEVTNDKQRFPLCVLTEEIHTPANAGLIFRTSEAMGVERIFLAEASFMKRGKKFDRVARATEKLIDFQVVPNIPDCIQQLKSEGYTVFALEITNNSQNIREVSFSPYPKIALVIGKERFGIQQDTLDVVDHCIEIPMHGVRTSMNVATALAIALYEITQQLQGK